jgi:putative hydrolase of the HAD superfamily
LILLTTEHAEGAESYLEKLGILCVLSGSTALDFCMIQAVLFDLDGTLRLSRPSSLDAFFQFSAELGLAFCIDARRAVERWTQAFWAGKHNGYPKTAPDPEAFWLGYTHSMLTVAGVQDKTHIYAQAIVQAFNERYHSENLIPDQAHTVLRAARDQGYTLGLVSNRVEDLSPVAVEIGLSDYFHFTLSGGQAGAWKPDARIFTRACEMAQAEPHQCLYVGDNFYADVVGAEAAGLVPVLLDPNDVFPEAGCMRIACLGDLLSVMSQSVAQ